MISVIIPAYNAEKYIERAIYSVLNQTYQNIEVIVVNDGSYDSTKEKVTAIAEKYKNVVLIDVANGGVSRARNIGIDKAKGKYISFLDADDELVSNALWKMRECLQQTGYDLCSTLYVNSYESVPAAYDNYTDKWDTETAIDNVINDHPATYSSCAKLYKKEALEGVRFPEGKRCHEDSFFVFLCILKGLKFVQYDTVTYIYYENTHSVTRSAFDNEKMMNMIDLSKEKVRLINSSFPEMRTKSVNIMIKVYMSVLQNLCRSEIENCKCVEKEAISYIQKNKNYFVPAAKSNKIWFSIVKNHMYGIYKVYYRLRQKIKQY